jgi:hypothetical protein
VYRRDRTLPRSASAFVSLVRQGASVTTGEEMEGKVAHRR